LVLVDLIHLENVEEVLVHNDLDLRRLDDGCEVFYGGTE
jgi:hypothetical protein